MILAVYFIKKLSTGYVDKGAGFTKDEHKTGKEEEPVIDGKKNKLLDYL